MRLFEYYPTINNPGSKVHGTCVKECSGESLEDSWRGSQR